MIVKDLIANLQAYGLDEEIAVVYWDRFFMEAITGLKPSDVNWENAVERFEHEEWNWQNLAHQTLVSLIEEEIEEDPDIIASSGDGDTLRII